MQTTSEYPFAIQVLALLFTCQLVKNQSKLLLEICFLLQVLCVVDREKDDDEDGNPRLVRNHVGGVRFVPLTRPEEDEIY
jgi:hypothetical protein